MPFSIGHFSTWLSIDPCLSLHGIRVFSTKALLGYLGPVWLHFFSRSSKLQWVAADAEFPGNELATRLAKPKQHFSLCQCKDNKAHPLRYLETKSYSQFSLLPDSFDFFRGTISFPHCKLFRLCCHGYSLLLSSYLCRIKRKEIRSACVINCRM